MNTELSPVKALESELLWVIHSGTQSGQALPVLPGNMGRVCGLDDPSVSRCNLKICKSDNHWRARPVRDAAPVYKLWTTLGFSCRIHSEIKIKPGCRIRLGNTVLRVIRRPTDLRLNPPKPASRFSGRWLWIGVLPVAALAGMSAMMKWRALVVAGILGILGLTALWRIVNSVPHPELLWLCAATTPQESPQQGKSIRIYTQKLLFNRIWDIQAGESVCFVGPFAADMARWVISQALLYGQAVLHEDNSSLWKMSSGKIAKPDSLKIRVVSSKEPQYCHSDEIIISVCRENPPAWVTRILAAQKLRYNCSEEWFSGLLHALERNPAVLKIVSDKNMESLPSLVDYKILGENTPEVIKSNWKNPKLGLETTLGLRTDGSPWVVDLVKEGPHALVAGTTGAGKSELLTSWIIGLSLRYSPAQLRLILIDYKGGATFGLLSKLPHVHGVLTDLYPQLTARALCSLEAFLKQREKQLAEVNARDIEHYAKICGRRLPRVLIVVDEFRALATEHSEILENLVRLATHGRSLGLHLILATQKPGGIVSAQIMSNTNLRICLRVRTDLDSREILMDSRGANLPAIAGRLYWEGNTEGLAQSAWCGTNNWVEETVDKLSSIWHGELPQIWCPELPREVTAPPNGFALLDCPRQAIQTWCSVSESLGIFGNPGTGKTAALITLAYQKLPDHQVYVITHNPEEFKQIDSISTREMGVCSDSQDSWRVEVLSHDNLWGVHQLVSRAEKKQLRGSVVLVDRADFLIDSLESIYPGQGVKQCEMLLGGAAGGGYTVAFTAPLKSGHCTWAGLCAQRLVLCPRDTTDMYSAGVTIAHSTSVLSDVLPATLTAGRGVWQSGANSHECQVGLAHRPQIDSKALPQKDDHFSSSGISAWHLPTNFSAWQMPRESKQITIGWSAQRKNWLSYTPQRDWIIEDTAQLRPLLAQLKREYRRLGYLVIDAESLKDEHKNTHILAIASTDDYNLTKLQDAWEKDENKTNFDLTILELRSPAKLYQKIPNEDYYFTKAKTTILGITSSGESRLRACSLLQADTELVRKLQVITDFPAIYRDEYGIDFLQAPNDTVRHLI